MRSIPRRGVAIVLLLAVLGGLCVQYGALTPDPSAHRFPGNEEFAAGNLHAGDRVILGGTVRSVEADRAVVALDGGPRLVVHGLGDASNVGADPDPDPGDGAWFYGVVRADGSVSAERAVVRARWESQYLYGASLLGGLLVLVRFVRTWRFDTDRWQFVPREESRG